jgi:hypothetical protein
MDEESTLFMGWSIKSKYYLFFKEAERALLDKK